jgi:hypothetical protein
MGKKTAWFERVGEPEADRAAKAKITNLSINKIIKIQICHNYATQALPNLIMREDR